MKKLSSIMESVATADDAEIEQSLVDTYFSKFGKKKEITDDVKVASMLCSQYNINSKSLFDSVVSASASALKNISTQVGVSVDALKELKKLLTKLGRKGQTVYIPQAFGLDKLNNVISGKEDFDEATLDFNSEQGATEIAHKYQSVIDGAVKGNLGKSSLTRDDLLSVCWAALAYCIKTYNKNEKVSLKEVITGVDVDKKRSDGQNKAIDAADAELNSSKKASFRTYLTNAINNAIRIEMNWNGRNVRTPQNELDDARENGTGIGRETSIDKTFGDEDSGGVDHYRAIGVDDNFSDMSPAKEAAFNKFIEQMTKVYGARNVEWLKKSFGIGTEDGEKMSQEEIAKEAGVSQRGVGKAIDKMLKDLMTNPKLAPYKELVRQAFFESLAVEFVNSGYNRYQIKEALLNNDIFIMFCEDEQQNQNVEYKINDILYNNFSVNDAMWLKDLFEGKVDLKEEFEWNKNKIRQFLNKYDIFENYNDASDNELYSKIQQFITIKE